jgi:hypothetical protein
VALGPHLIAGRCSIKLMKALLSGSIVFSAELATLKYTFGVFWNVRSGLIV